MRLTDYPIKTVRDDPAEEVALNAKLLIRAGYIHKEMAGVYSLLPAGLRVVENIKQIVREEMNNIGGQELLMSSLQHKDIWQETDRWDEKKVDIWFKTHLQNGTEVGLAWSHEEPITAMLRNHIASYRDLPAYVYQFQTKLRNEVRAKSGIMRGREFIMKDLYSYTEDEAAHEKFYNSVIEAYHKTFDRLGIGDITYLTFASGGAFTKFSHEFQTVTETGEDIIFLDKKKKLAVNKEVLDDDVLKELDLNRSDLVEARASEVGNIFNFKDKKSKEMGLLYTDHEGNERPVILGSYGIGITRLLGVITEVMADDKGLIWPSNIAPWKVYLAALEGDEAAKKAEQLYEKLEAAGIDTVFDDRDVPAGEKFNDADLLGIPYRLVVSSKTLNGAGVELKKRTSDKTEIISAEEVLNRLT